MRRHLLLLALFAYSLLGCGTFNVKVRFIQPAQATATAQAALTPSPTPAPRLGKIAFVRGGDLWVLNLDTGQELRLTQGIWSKRPSWSPSGRWIAFFKTHELWTVPAEGGTPRRISETAVARAVWSPVEDRLAYVTRSGGLWVVNADGSGRQELIPGPGDQVVAGAGAITWSPDGRWLAFRWREGQPNEPPTYEGLRRIRADGTQPAEVYSALRPPQRYDGIALASWSPDGSHLAVWLIPSFSASLAADGGPLLTVSAGDGTAKRIAEAVLLYSDFAAWSPDGERLAVVAGGPRETWLNKRLMVATADGRSTQFLTPPTEAVLSPAWSPDGQRLAYVSATAMPGVAGGEAAFSAMAGRRIWIIRADGSDPRQLTQDSRFRDEAPQWSADGSHILFVRLQGQSPNLKISLWLMRADGSGQRAVVEEIGPISNPFGFYGYIDWRDFFDWWTGSPQPRAAVRVPTPGPISTSPPPPTPTVVPSTSTPGPTPTAAPLRPAVVRVRFYGEDGNLLPEHATGVVLGPHGDVVFSPLFSDARLEVVLPTGRAVSARLLVEDPATSLALLRVEGLRLPAATMGSSRALKVGDQVLAAGYDAEGQYREITARVAATDATLPPSTTGLIRIEPEKPEGPWFDSASFQGGPLADAEGRVVGILLTAYGNMYGSLVMPVEQVVASLLPR